MLTAIKLLHSLIWAFLAASILALPVVGIMRRFRWTAILTGLVLLECGVLAVNGGGCPLSDSGVLELTVLKVGKAQRARMHPNATSSELLWQSEGFDPPTNHNFKQQREKS
jgi:hypothetical protein